MTLVRPQRGQFAAGVQAVRSAWRRWMINGLAALVVLALLGVASSASALIITGGPTYTLPGGGSCSVSNVTSQTGGATISCTGVNLAAHTKVYFGMRVDTSPNGNTMTNVDPAASSAAVFRILSTTASSITYSSTTTVNHFLIGPQVVSNRGVLTLTAGSATVVSTGGIPANSAANGDIANLFQLTGGSSFTFRADVQAPPGASACPATYDPAHTTAGGDRSRINVAFYYSDCGDGFVDSPEQCDDGVNNNTLGSCCTSTCTYKPMGTLCTDEGNPCTDDTCNGSSAICQHPNNSAPCSDGVFCNGTDTCSGGTCSINAGDPCLPLNTGDANCSTSCNEGADNCTAPDPNGTGCNDSLFCNGTDTCSGGTCSTNTGDPCPGPDGDTNCSESCNEAGDNCLAPDADGTLCRGSAGACDVVDTCSSGVCPADAVQPSGTLCNAGSGDLCDPDDVCDGSSASCPADTIAPSGTLCRTGSGDSCDPDESCTGVADAPCPGDVVTPSGTVCNAGSGDSCDPDEVCTGTAGQPCPSDTITSSGTLCRAGSGDLCDPDENCTGVADATCPADVVTPSGTVCLTGSGDSCDPDETCTGTAGQTCPADTVTPSGTLCRAGSGDTCDPDEVCTGATGQPCPADVITPSGTQCRAGSGDLCDPDESCTGTAGQACPADVVEPTSTVCRPAVGPCDTPDNCTGVALATCSADAKEPTTTECREDAGACDVAENCDGSNDACPTDLSQPDGTDCSDGLFCNGDETCQSGSCAPGTSPCTFICSEASDMCLTTACPNAPSGGCRTSTKKQLLIKSKDDDNKDKLIWKFLKGAQTTQADFANPTSVSGATYALCIYAGTADALVATLTVPPSTTKWTASGDKGYKYKDLTNSQSGVSKITLKGGAAGKTKALLKAKGVNVPDPLDPPGTLGAVTAQLLNYQTGICWETSFNTPTKDTDALYKAKQ